MKKDSSVEARLLSRLHVAARVVLALVFIYHGLVPKILWLSPVEAGLVQAHHLPASIISPLAGMGEILLGIAVLLLRKTLLPIYAAIAMLLVLLLDVVVFMPGLLIEAFNPVTTNLAAMFAAYVVVMTQAHAPGFTRKSA